MKNWYEPQCSFIRDLLYNDCHCRTSWRDAVAVRQFPPDRIACPPIRQADAYHNYYNQPFGNEQIYDECPPNIMPPHENGCARASHCPQCRQGCCSRFDMIPFYLLICALRQNSCY